MRLTRYPGLITAALVVFTTSLQGQPVITALSPKALVVEAGSVNGRAILRGSSLQTMREVRAVVGGKTSDYILARPLELPDGSRELRLLVRPDAPPAVYRLVALGEGWSLPVPGTVEVVPVGDRRAQMSGGEQDLREAARRSTSGTLVVDRATVPLVTGTYPSPLVLAPESRTRTVRLAGKNLDRVTDVRIRRETEEPRYRQNQGKLPFVCRDGFLDLSLVTGARTPVGTRYALDLMVEKFRAHTLVLEVGVPPPPAAATPESAVKAAEGPRVIELPPMPPADASGSPEAGNPGTSATESTGAEAQSSSSR
ncbi:MAG: hypothetical protein SFU85_08700 [Candidatus Methylacidiphilales bacterium]|nr:hypothetical protein [Candidatus Methylacidiphilales bacterium]